MEAIHIDTIIGTNVAERRIGTGNKHRPEYSQTRLAEYLKALTDSRWDQREMSRAENGKRPFTVADILVLGLIFQVSPIRLMQPGTECSIWLGRIGIPEGDLLEHWILGPRKAPEYDLDEVLAEGFDPDQLKPPPFDPEELTTKWPEQDAQRTWAIDRLADEMVRVTTQGKDDTDGDD